MQTGEKINVGYICDCHKHNNDEGIITWVHPFKYYPNGNINHHIIKTQLEVTFSDNTKLMLTR